MDGILSLFETVTLPNNHAFIFKDYLKICAEHQVFINKTPNDVKPVVSYINGKLNSATNRIEGLYMLQTFLPQCSKEIFRENALTWLHQCLKAGDGKSTQITVLSYQLIKTLLQMTQQMPEMRRTVSSIVVIKLVENLQHNIQSQSLLAILECTETLMCNYGPACGHHKNVLEKILLQHIDSTDRNVVNRLARCMAQMPLLSNAGPMGANHTGRWNQEQQKLCSTLHGILDEVFGLTEENTNIFDVKISSTKLPLPEISSDLPLIKVTRLVNRFNNVAEIFRGLLLLKFSADKMVNPEAVLQLVCRGLSVTSKSIRDSAAAEIQMTKALLPRIHVALLKILNALIICVGCHLIPYGPAICKQVLQVLSWTSTSKWAYSIEKPFGELRAAACNTLVLWLQTSMSGSSVDRIADKLVHNLIPDINPGKTAITLIEDASPKKGSSKQLKKFTIAERNVQTDAISPDLELHIADPKANSKVCRAALKVMQWILVTSSTFINTIIHEKLQNISVKLLNDIQKTGKRHLLPVPYSDSHCRDELYKLLLTTVMNPHPLRPAPINQAISIFASGCSDTDIEVAVACRMGLECLEKLISGTRPTQHFPITIEEMLDSVNAQQEDMDQEIEDEAEQIEDEIVEEEEDEVVEEEEEEEEEEEDEDEDEEIEDELELSKIKVGEAVSILPDKSAPEQMEIEEEPAKKTELKKTQRPVEKPEVSKKEEDDEVEVLSEDEEEWHIRKDRKEKIVSEADEMLEDEDDEYVTEDEEDEEVMEDLEDEDEDSAEIESEGEEEIDHKIVVHNKSIKSMPVEIEKKDVTICESKNDSKNNIQKSEITQQPEENVNEVALANTEHVQSQDKMSLPSANNSEEKAKELDSSIEEVQVENVQPSNEILESSVEENAEQNKEVMHPPTEEIEETPAIKEHVAEKIDENSQNEVEKEKVIVEMPEFQDVEDQIAVSIVENKRLRMEYHEIDDRDIHAEDNDDGMHEEYDEQMEEENAFESKNDRVEDQEINQNELLDASDKPIEENDKDVTEEPEQVAEVCENVNETADNELIQNDVATVEREVVQHEDNTNLKLEVSDEMHKQVALEEDSNDKKEYTCGKEVVSEQNSDIPKSEDHVLNDEVCTDNDNTVVDSGDSEARFPVISEVKSVNTEDMHVEVNEMAETELNAAAQKIAHSPENEEIEEPSRKKMKMDVTATFTDGPKATDTEISNLSADVKLNSTGEVSNSEPVMNGTDRNPEDVTDEEVLASFVPEVNQDIFL